VNLIFPLQGPGGPLPVAAIGGSLLFVIGLAIFLVGALRGPSLLRAAGLLLVLIGFFVMFTALLWRLGPESPALSTIVLLGAVGVFRLMAAFEQAPRTASSPGEEQGGRSSPRS
jgi:hypothetical protein